MCLVAQSCLTLCDPTDCSLPGSSVHGILQARILEWAAIPFSRGSFQPRDRTCVCSVYCIAGGFFFYHCTSVTATNCVLASPLSHKASIRSLGNSLTRCHHFSNKKESFPRQVDRESRGPQGERGLEFSRRKKGQTFLSPHSLGLYNNNVSCLRTVFGFNLLLS